MAEYIEREWLVNEAEAVLDFRKKYYTDIERIKDAASTVEWLKYYAPAADVVEVVRCKDCKHYWNYGRTSMLVDDKNIKCGWCRRRIRYDEEHRMLADDFCSYGERRADNATD